MPKLTFPEHFTENVIVYLHRLQYLHVLQESKRYVTHPTAQVQPKFQVTDISPIERQVLGDDYLSHALSSVACHCG